jgi:virginiamycin B lyase
MIDIVTRAARTLVVPGSADFFVADDDAVWITNRGRIEKLDAGHDGPVATVAVPSPCGVMAQGFGSVWVANCDDASIYRVDSRTHAVTAVIPAGLADPEGELSLAAGAGSVWVLSDRAGVLSRIDPATNEVVARIAVAPYSYGAAFGFGSVWITNSGKPASSRAGTVQRIDPRNNEVVATIAVGPTPWFLGAGEGGVWTLNQGDGSVSRIDPATNAVVATIMVPDADGDGGDIATGAGRVWVRATKALLTVIDPATNIVTEQFGPPAGSGAVRVAGNYVWISAHDVQTVWAIPVSGQG